MPVALGSPPLAASPAKDPPPNLANAATDEVTTADAARTLLRHLLSDGVPCAPLEQFKYDEIYRATGKFTVHTRRRTAQSRACVALLGKTW